MFVWHISFFFFVEIFLLRNGSIVSSTAREEISFFLNMSVYINFYIYTGKISPL